MADMADAPGGGSLAFTAPSLQLSMRFDAGPILGPRPSGVCFGFLPPR
jgi:hypothetical protein